MALATPRSWVRFPGKARPDKNVETVTWMQCKSLWIKASAKCINVNVSHSFTVNSETWQNDESYIHSLPLSRKWTVDELHFSENIILKWRSLNCKLAGVFRKQACLSIVERERVHMVARLTKISNTLSRYFRIAQVGSSVSGITSLYIRQPSCVLLRPD